ncbi:hypothetical protein BGZ65_005494, partial [Modicella reniformis]
MLHAEIIAQTRKAKLEKWRPDLCQLIAESRKESGPESNNVIPVSEKIVWVDWLEEYQAQKEARLLKLKDKSLSPALSLSVLTTSQDQAVSGDARSYHRSSGKSGISISSGGSLIPSGRRSKPPHGLRIDSRSPSGVSVSSHKSQQSSKGGLGPKLVNWWKSVRRKSMSLVQPRKAVESHSTSNESTKSKNRSHKKQKESGQAKTAGDLNPPPLPSKDVPISNAMYETSGAKPGPLVLTTALNQSESTSPTKSAGTKTSPREKPGLSIKVNMAPPLVRRSSVMVRTSSFSAGISAANAPEGSPQQPGLERSNKTIRSILEQCKADCDEEMRKIIDGLNEYVEKGLNYVEDLDSMADFTAQQLDQNEVEEIEGWIENSQMEMEEDAANQQL